MKNLCYFCHYHRGTPRDITVKILGSLVILTSIAVWSAAAKVGDAAENEASYLAQLLPEPVYYASQEDGFQGGDEGIPPLEENEGAPTKRQASGKPSNMPPKPSGGGMPSPTSTNSGEQPPSSQDNQEQNEDEEEERRLSFERENACRDMKNIQRDLKRQTRELGRLCKKLQTLNAGTDDLQSCQDLQNQLQLFKEQFSVCRSDMDPEDIRDQMSEYWDMEIWEKIQVIRNKVEFPKEHNRIFKELTRINKLLAGRTWARYGFAVDSIKSKVAEWMKVLEEAKGCYSQGDFECANELLEEFRENYPGNCVGALHNLQNLYRQSRSIRDKTIRQEVIDLFAEAITLLQEGECQDSRILFESIFREMGPDFWRKIFDSQKSGGLGKDMLEKIRALQEKFQGGSDDEADSSWEQESDF